jgi:DNA-binding GntR family transcriptional regulator
VPGKTNAISRGSTSTAVDPYGAEYAYVQVAADIQRRIAEGEIELKLPSERSFAEEYEVAYTTVRHAMTVLRDQGIIITVHGRGTFVTPHAPGNTQT